MIAPQPPPLPIFISAQSVPGRDVPSQHLPPIAAVETNHVVPMHGSPHRYNGSENHFWFRGLSKLTNRPMNGANQIRKLIRPQPMVPDIALDDFGG
jgi:hypothetical protein